MSRLAEADEGLEQFFDPVHAGTGERLGKGFGRGGRSLNGKQLAQKTDLVGQCLRPGGAGRSNR